ncbi:hypothetical protein M409DRAFT_29144 [Zasmidium cellare ATCC 36951]|uniref:Uncharacterized protein n=1 Tax=Zasmidium cellare ATCC 36951 TaxID=1080233 RepID=A0A6A6C0E6_ZASCE|nr:uncharacterized protein M409DRAFT_29144 [Zasmidium cellare ATCC 36951]KAF2160524.1 hypothetical protein M409DRAFT_29144 [Zasmidium cellare ATCC 36951]
MSNSTLQAQSKKQRLVELGRAIFKRQSGSNTISARSQRVFRATKAKGIWKNGLEKARQQWGKVRKHKRSTKRESTFDSIYPVGRTSRPIQHDFSQLYQDFTPEQSPFPPGGESNRTSAVSVTVTTPSPSNSQRDQGKRQSQYIVHNPDEPSPLFTGRLRPRPESVSIAQPPASMIGEAPSSPTTARTSSNTATNSDVSSKQWSSRMSPRSRWSLSGFSSGSPTPDTENFPGQVNPNEVAKKRKSKETRRDSNDILDGHPRSDRQRLSSQGEHTAVEVTLPLRRASIPPQTPSVLKPGRGASRPATMHFTPPKLSPVQESAFSSPDRNGFEQGPEIPPVAFPGTTMEGLRKSIYDIAGHPLENQHSCGRDEALDALEGKRPFKTAARLSTVRFGGSELSPVQESAFSSPDRSGFKHGPELPHIPYPDSTMGDLRDSLYDVGNTVPKAQPDAHIDTLAALEGKRPIVREPSQITDREVDSAMNANHARGYPGQGAYRTSKYEPFQKGKVQKPKPVPIATMGRSRTTTPNTPPRSSRGKQPADARVRENLEKAREEVDKKHKRLSEMLDHGVVVTPASVSMQGSSADGSSESPLEPNPDPVAAPRPPPITITRKPVAKQPSQKKPDVHKPLPTLPPTAPPSAGRLTLLETRLAALESQVATRPRAPLSNAAAAAGAAASLHSAIRAGSTVPRGPHRARASRKRDVHHEYVQPEQPSAGKILRDVVGLGRGVWWRL